MLRSLFAGISGLRSNQTMLDVTGNNIANANTTGFKSSATVFSDTLSQMLTAASASGTPAATTRGGTNPIQIGLGVQVAATNTNFTQGSTQLTGRPTDLMIQGDGFFEVSDGAQTLYTRAGAFSFDNTGALVTPSGMRVQGADGNPVQIPLGAAATDLASYNIGKDGVIRGVCNDGSAYTGQTVRVTNFPNPMGLEKTGDTTFRASANSGAPVQGVPGASGNGQIVAGALEMSNVDLSQEFTNLILAQRGFQASSRVITTSDQVLEELVNLKR
jgi:flagellar hook protein FlgE